VATDQSLERLFSLHPKLIDLSLGRIERLLAALGHPERQLPPVIHVAGTNGKGSVTAFLRALIEAQGLTAQAYTSPHLVRFHERIRLSSGLITEEALQHVLDNVEEVNAGQAITFFEATTVVAFQAFAADHADFCLLEVGLGGKFDATNVIEPPMACIITPVAMDHEGFLGHELAGIAEEKAGILKRGVPAFIARQDPVAMEVITRRAAEVGAPIFFAGRDWTVRQQDGALIYSDAMGELKLPLPKLAGAHQIDNAAVALACLRYQGHVGSHEHTASAMQNVQWPARLQPIDQGPLFELRRGKGTLTLDGGHNVHAATALAQHFGGRKVNLVLGLMENREIVPILEVLGPIIGHLGAISIPGEASHDPADIAQVAISMGVEAQAYDSVEAALAGLPDGDALIAGSLYLAGHVLEASGLLPK
jgi:dihydrofolate synthase / folylpolyglutamate synthase